MVRAAWSCCSPTPPPGSRHTRPTGPCSWKRRGRTGGGCWTSTAPPTCPAPTPTWRPARCRRGRTGCRSRSRPGRRSPASAADPSRLHLRDAVPPSSGLGEVPDQAELVALWIGHHHDDALGVVVPFTGGPATGLHDHLDGAVEVLDG